MRIDLHSHTTVSDGLLSPVDLVHLADRRGLDVLGITDHDTVGGIAEAEDAARSTRLRVVPGLEVSTRAAGRTHHVLGFFVRADDERLVSLLDTMSAERLDRARRMVDRLCELGYELTFEEVEQIAGRGVVARPHVARALVARGHVGSVKDAFNTLLADGGPADVRRRVPTAEEGVHLIRDAGGAAVLAHPAVAAHDGDARAVREAFVEGLAGAGLAGLEVDHPDHDPGVREELRRLAADLDLVATGGSDFHGGDPEWLGVCLTHPDALEALEARATA